METTLFEKAIEALEKQKRPELVDVTVYGKYTSKKQTYLYNDSEQCYERHKSIPPEKNVRSVKAFVEIIKEELKRRENETGQKSTVRIGLDGGWFVPDDDFGGEVVTFTRLHSQQWISVKAGINRVYNHRDFLKLLQTLAPSIDNFTKVFKSFSLLRLVGKSVLTSNPVITAEGQSEGYTCTYKLEDGCDGEEHFPTGFCLRVPFTKAGEKFYDIDIELLFFRNENDELRIEVQCPLFENVEEQAVIDEAKFIKEQTETYTDLLVLSDF